MPTLESLAWLNPANWPGPAILTAVLLVVFATVGMLLLHWDNTKAPGDLGVALVSGSIISLSVLLLQLVNERIAQDQARQAEKDAERRAFELAIAVSRDLSGFDPGNRKLDDMVLSAKNFERANFRNTSLKEAIIVDAELVDADLKGADLYGADLDYSKMTGAELQGAKLEGASLRRVALGSAEVNDETCWPDRAFMNRMEQNNMWAKLEHPPGEIGHVCDKGEHWEAAAYGSQ